MTYQEALDFLNALTDFERLGFHRHFAEVVGLDSAERLLAMLGNPHRAVPVVHIAGTKGKGSTAAMVESVLRQAGYRTGLFTSPHLVSFRERVQVSGEPIPEAAMVHWVETVQPAFRELRETPGLSPCTFFEVYFAIAALHFAQEGVDIAIYETGLGGRLDVTNLLLPLVSAVTTIGFDHMDILGDTLEAIAQEKAEIAKPGVPLVVSRSQPPEAMRTICEVASRKGAEVVFGPEVARREPPVRARALPGGGFERPVDVFVWADPPPPGRPLAHHAAYWERGEGKDATCPAGQATGVAGEVRCPLVGAHQAPNIGVALGILEQLGSRGYTIGGQAVAAGLEQVRWPGRFDVRGCRPWVVFDCAHNPQSGRALARALPEYLEYDRLALVVGMSEDKDVAAFAEALGHLGAQVILTRADLPRALPPEELQRRAAGAWEAAELVPSVPEACRCAVALAGEAGAVCVTGSFYVVGEAMEGMGVSH